MPFDEEKAERRKIAKLKKSKTLAALKVAGLAIKKAEEMVSSD